MKLNQFTTACVLFMGILFLSCNSSNQNKKMTDHNCCDSCAKTKTSTQAAARQLTDDILTTHPIISWELTYFQNKWKSKVELKDVTNFQDEVPDAIDYQWRTIGGSTTPNPNYFYYINFSSLRTTNICNAPKEEVHDFYASTANLARKSLGYVSLKPSKLPPPYAATLKYVKSNRLINRVDHPNQITFANNQKINNIKLTKDIDSLNINLNVSNPLYEAKYETQEIEGSQCYVIKLVKSSDNGQNTKTDLSIKINSFNKDYKIIVMFYEESYGDLHLDQYCYLKSALFKLNGF